MSAAVDVRAGVGVGRAARRRVERAGVLQRGPVGVAERERVDGQVVADRDRARRAVRAAAGRQGRLVAGRLPGLRGAGVLAVPADVVGLLVGRADRRRVEPLHQQDAGALEGLGVAHQAGLELALADAEARERLRGPVHLLGALDRPRLLVELDRPVQIRHVDPVPDGLADVASEAGLARQVVRRLALALGERALGQQAAGGRGAEPRKPCTREEFAAVRAANDVVGHMPSRESGPRYDGHDPRDAREDVSMLPDGHISTIGFT